MRDRKSKQAHESIRKPLAPPTIVIQDRRQRVREREDAKALADAEWEISSGGVE